MQVSIAIDFTLSNREINDCRSLHRLHTNSEMNHYEKVIFEVCNVLSPLIKQRKFNAYGFGGIPKYCGDTEVSKLWNLNGDPDDAGVDGTVGVLAAYTKAQKGTQLAGPSYFASLLKKIEGEIIQEIDDAGGIESNRLYHLVIIVTDGFCNDMKETIRQLVALSGMPFSAVIVGIGEGTTFMLPPRDPNEQERLANYVEYVNKNVPT